MKKEESKESSSISFTNVIRVRTSQNTSLLLSQSVQRCFVQSINSILLKSVKMPALKSLQSKKSRISNRIDALKSSFNQKRRPFLVADIESLIKDDIHVPYAAGYLALNPNDNLTSIPEEERKTFLCEYHSHPKFDDRSALMSSFYLRKEYYLRRTRVSKKIKVNSHLKHVHREKIMLCCGAFSLESKASRPVIEQFILQSVCLMLSAPLWA